MSKQCSISPSQLLAFVSVLGYILFIGYEPVNRQMIEAGKPEPVQLTPSLAAWISAQSEGIVAELEAIARQSANSNRFSIVNYLRYLELYNSLKVLSDRKNVPELQWVSKKVKAFSTIYKSVVNLLQDYLVDLGNALSLVEAEEPKSKQVTVSKKWIELYERIHYIATHVSITR